MASTDFFNKLSCLDYGIIVLSGSVPCPFLTEWYRYKKRRYKQPEKNLTPCCTVQATNYSRTCALLENNERFPTFVLQYRCDTPLPLSNGTNPTSFNFLLLLLRLSGCCCSNPFGEGDSLQFSPHPGSFLLVLHPTPSASQPMGGAVTVRRHLGNQLG